MVERVGEQEVRKASENLKDVKKEISKIVVGQEAVVDGMLKALLANGHVLLEGVPGIAKTLIMRAMGVAVGCECKRIQFTPDLLPSDLVGITTYTKEKGFAVVKGPVFTNFVLADEINRAPPKVQSALLECMQEKQATIGRETFTMAVPFLVMATENPIESVGTYPLPHAQVDRFLFKVLIGYPNTDEELIVLNRNMTLNDFNDYGLKAVLNARQVLEMQEIVKRVYASQDVAKYIVSLVDATRNPKKYGLKSAKYIEYGGSPRASIGLYIAAKAQALITGKNYVTPQHVKDVAQDVLRHRLLLSYEGQAENVKTDEVIQELLARVKP